MNLEEITNDRFAQVDEGYVTGDETPAMTTPLAATAAEYAVAGSTICLVC